MTRRPMPLVKFKSVVVLIQGCIKLDALKTNGLKGPEPAQHPVNDHSRHGNVKPDRQWRDFGHHRRSGR